LRQAENVSVYLHANALSFDAGENGGEVRQVNVGVLPHQGDRISKEGQ
jgi:hypothetical protein